MLRDREAELRMCLTQAAEILRPTVHGFEYKYYVLRLLFLRLLSDILFAQSDPDARHYSRLFDLELSSNVGATINDLLSDVEKRYPTQLGGVLRGVDFSESRLGSPAYGNKILSELVSCFAPQNLARGPLGNDKTKIGSLFSEAIVLLASSSKEGGEYVTPTEVSNLLGRVIAQGSGEDFYDPACGSGSLLLAAIREASKVSDISPQAYGQERNGAAWCLARMSFFLAGLDATNISHGNSILSPLDLPNGKLRQYDVVISNPPWSTTNWGWEHAKSDPFGRFNLGMPPKSNGDFAFILHMVATLKPDTGRMAVLVSNGTLSRGGSEAGIRKRLLERGLIDTIIALPPKLFFNTNIATNLLVLRASRSTLEVLFIDASREYESIRGRNRLTEQGANRVLEVFLNRLSEPGFSAVVGPDAFEDDNVDLNVKRFVKTEHDLREIDLPELRLQSQAIQEELENLNAELNEVFGLLEQRWE